MHRRRAFRRALTEEQLRAALEEEPMNDSSEDDGWISDEKEEDRDESDSENVVGTVIADVEVRPGPSSKSCS